MTECIDIKSDIYILQIHSFFIGYLIFVLLHIVILLHVPNNIFSTIYIYISRFDLVLVSLQCIYSAIVGVICINIERLVLSHCTVFGSTNIHCMNCIAILSLTTSILTIVFYTRFRILRKCKCLSLL